jgi:hypothetical protein
MNAGRRRGECEESKCPLGVSEELALIELPRHRCANVAETDVDFPKADDLYIVIG